MVHTILSYCKSHIYELHALLAAAITFMVMQFIKSPIKVKITDWVSKKIEIDEKWMDNKKKYTKRAKSIIMIIAIAMSYFVFALISTLSPVIHYSKITAFLTAVFSIDIYAVYELITGGGKHE